MDASYASVGQRGHPELRGKPDGLFVIRPKMGPTSVETLPVRKFYGIGPATARTGSPPCRSCQKS
jgi:nucleotidyltransferase/DNA polymerase involved in DNA repair